MVAASSLLSDQFICNLGGSKVVEFLPPAATMEGVDYAALGSAFDRISSENNCLRQEVSSLKCELSELFSVVGRLREDLDGLTADHDRLSVRVGWQHARMVRLGGFNPYQSFQSSKDSRFLPVRDGT